MQPPMAEKIAIQADDPSKSSLYFSAIIRLYV